MPFSSSAKKTPGEAGSSKKVSGDVTPIRISSRVRKEKFNVKELFSISKDKDSSDDELVKPTPKKKLVAPTKALSDRESKVHVVRVDVTKSLPKQFGSTKIQETNLTKPGSSKFITKTIVTKRMPDGSIPKEYTRVKQGKTTKEEDRLDQMIVEDIKIEPIFNEDNIDTVLENPSSLGLDIVVTKLSDSDQRDQNESKKSKNVVTIAKVTGSTPASKPIKVVPMKPSDKISDDKSDDDTLDFKGSGVVITPKLDKVKSGSSVVTDKKNKIISRTGTKNEYNQNRDSKSVKSHGDVFVVDYKSGSIGKSGEKRRDVTKQIDGKVKSKVYPTIIEVELDKAKGKIDNMMDDRTREANRQKAVKRSLSDVITEFKTNGHKPVKSNRIKSAEADSSSPEIESQKARVVEEIFGDMETEVEETKMPSYEFDRYFVTSESIIEHNESLDSDCSNEGSETYLSHFYEKESLNNNRKRRRHADSSNQDDEYTIYDLMYEVNCEFPSWNLHVMQDTASFLICQACRGPRGLPVLTKMIELQPDLASAKVYINDVFYKEFSGSYNTYENIKELISSVHELSDKSVQ